MAADHGATGYVEVGDIPDVHADAALVRQVLDNLLGNALKFVPPGEEPRVSVTGRRTDPGTVAIAVADEGIGLPPGAHERDLRRSTTAPTRRTTDAGSGLAICRRIVERHGGSITARDNSRAAGAVFEFTLPSPGLTCAPCRTCARLSRTVAAVLVVLAVVRAAYDDGPTPEERRCQELRAAANAVASREDTVDDELEYLRRAGPPRGCESASRSSASTPGRARAAPGDPDAEVSNARPWPACGSTGGQRQTASVRSTRSATTPSRLPRAFVRRALAGRAGGAEQPLEAGRHQVQVAGLLERRPHPLEKDSSTSRAGARTPSTGCTRVPARP